MKQKTRILIYILIAAAAVMIGVIAVFSKAGGGESALGHIDLGRTYLIELSYDKAVIEFTEAIRIDPNNADAYLGLAEAYEKMGDMDKAIEWLEKGFEMTGDEKIGEMLDRLKKSGETAVPAETVSKVDNKVRVPYLSGMTEENAVNTCEEIGLKCEISYSNSSNVEKGYVISQSAPAAAEIDKGSVVKIEVSEGISDMAEIYVPEDIIGFDECLASYEGNTIFKLKDKYNATVCLDTLMKGRSFEFASENREKSSFGNGALDIRYNGWGYHLLYYDCLVDQVGFFHTYDFCPKISVFDSDSRIIQRAENEYDSENRLMKSARYNGKGELIDMDEYIYNESGNIECIKGTNSIKEFLYDDAGNCVNVTTQFLQINSSYIIEYKYNKDNQCIEQKESDNIIQWKYDDTGKISEIIVQCPIYIRKYIFDKNGNLLEDSYKHLRGYTYTSLYGYTYGNTTRLANAFFEHNENGDWIASKYYIESTDKTIQISEEFKYEDGRKIGKTCNRTCEYNDGRINNDNSTIDYVYDKYGRLIEENLTGIDTDSDGNKKTYQVYTLYTYDEHGNIVKKEQISTEDNKSDTSIYTYKYDEHSNIVKADRTDTDFNGNTFTKSCEIKYLKIEIPRIFIEQIKSDYGIDITE